MEAKETAGLLMTEKVARDSSSGLLETTSNRPWSAAKTNTPTVAKEKKGGERGSEEGGGANGKKVRLSNKKTVCLRIKKSKEGNQRVFGVLIGTKRG